MKDGFSLMLPPYANHTHPHVGCLTPHWLTSRTFKVGLRWRKEGKKSPEVIRRAGKRECLPIYHDIETELLSLLPLFLYCGHKHLVLWHHLPVG